MAAIITNKFRIHNAQSFQEGFSEVADTKMYLGIGRPQSWDNDNSPDTPTDTVAQEYYVWDDMLALKRVNSTDVSLATIRRNWVSGKYYDIYRHDYDGVTTGVNIDTGSATTPASLYDSNFFVITDDYNVYKCLNNTLNGSLQPSTYKPTGTSTGVITQPDGYVWKYMYTVAPADVLKFVSTDFIPVKSLGSDPGQNDSYYTQFLVEDNATDGSIDWIAMDTFGAGYTATPTVTIVGDGTGATAIATLDGVTNSITGIVITNAGQGYTWARVEIASPGVTGTQATATAIMSPKGGHGKDAVEELGGFYVMMNVRLEYDDGAGDFPIDNDYRRISLVRDPTLVGGNTIASASTLIANSTIRIDNPVGTFVVDEEIVDSQGARGTVVSVTEGTPTLIRYYQTAEVGANLQDGETWTFTAGETITGQDSLATGVIDSIDTPDVNHDSGDIIYVENRRPINRAGDQIEDIKIIVEM